MTHATEKATAGRQPCFLCEITADTCTKDWETRTKYDIVDNGTGYVRVTGDVDGAGFAVGADIGIREDNTNTADTIAAFEKNLLRYSEEMDNARWGHNANITHTLDSTTLPPGVNESWQIDDDGLGAAEEAIFANQQAVFEDNEQYMLSAYLLEGTATKCTLGLYDIAATAWRSKVEFAWAAGVLTVSNQITGTATVTSEGSGIYRANVLTPAAVVVAANPHRVLFMPTDISGATAGNTIIAGISLHKGTTAIEYQRTEDRDGTSTNVTLTSGGLTLDDEIGEDCFVAAAGTVCRATGAAGSECFDTRATCQYSSDYVKTTTTYKFAQSRETIPGTSGYISSMRNVTINTPMISRGEGLSVRGSARLQFQDHPHHDRGIDDYVANRTYTPEDQGTFWGKWLTRNKYYQNREIVIKTGYIGSTFDATNDFLSRTFLIDKITGPDARGRVDITCKDGLKPASDRRSKAPLASEGVLDSDITDSANSFTLTPSGIGADYPATGTVRINSEVLTYTSKAGDVFSGVSRGTNNTSAAAHSSGDTVQLCLVYSSARVDDVLYELLVTYGNIDSSYITFADWTAQVDEWLASSTCSAVISEPTGVMELVNEILTDFMIDMWWDDIDAQIRIKVLQPHGSSPDVLTDDDHFLAGSMRVTDEPEERISRIWVYYNRFNPTEPLDEERNYNVLQVNIDTDAESAEQYNEKRPRTIKSRWIRTSGDALRLASRRLNAARDNPRKFVFRLDAKEEYEIAGYITLDTASVQGETGANAQTVVYILGVTETKGPVSGHYVEVTAIDDAFDGRYGRVAPNGTADYGAATDAEKQRYAWVAENTEPQLDGDGPYLIV